MISFRTATSLDAEDVATLVNSAYRGDSSKKGWTTEADLLGGQRTDPEQIEEMIELPESQIELAVSEGRIVGCVHLKKEPPHTLYFGMLVTRPDLQSQGLGKAVLGHVETVARAYGYSRVRLNVIDVRHELIAYYERRGYAKTGALEPFPHHDPRFGIPKVADLKFTEMVKAL